MLVEFTRTTGSMIALNALLISAVTEPKRITLAPIDETSIVVAGCTYYVTESYDTVRDRVNHALQSLTTHDTIKTSH